MKNELLLHGKKKPGLYEPGIVQDNEKKAYLQDV